MTVSATEPALSLTIRATSVLDPSKYGEAGVTLTTAAAPQMPVFVTDLPAAKSATAGQQITFNVTAGVTDGGSLAYQWYKDGSPINGATGRVYTVTNSAVSHSGSYYVTVTNSKNSMTATAVSNICVLTVSSGSSGSKSSGGSGGSGGSGNNQNTSQNIKTVNIDDLIRTINNSKPDDIIRANMKGETIISSDVLKAMQSKGVTLILDMSDYTWTINSDSITTVPSNKRYNMKVTKSTGGGLTALTGKNEIAYFDIEHDGTLPFIATLNWNIGKEQAGKRVFLYRYNEKVKGLEYISASTVGSDGTVDLDFNHASRYALTSKVLAGSFVYESAVSSVSDVPYYPDNAGEVIVPISGIVAGTLTYIAPETTIYNYKDNSKFFSDISGHWASENIEFVTARELFSGAGDNKFDPDGIATRAMLVTALGRLHGVDISKYQDKSPFFDVDKKMWYAPYVAWAAESGIISGIGNGKFGPNDAVTREQLAVIILNYAEFIGYDLASVKDEMHFNDSYKIADWAKDSVKKIQMAGIMNGRTNISFNPKGLSTRAEVSTVLRKFIESVLVTR